MASATEELNVSFSVTVINFDLNNHMCLAVTILDKAILDRELFKEMEVRNQK